MWTLLVLLIAVYFFHEATKPVLIIDPITVPKRFEEVGLSAEVMANRIGDQITRLEEETRTESRKDELSSLKDEAAPPEIEIPGTKLSIKTVVDVLRSIFRIYPQHVSGDIVLPLKQVSTVEKRQSDLGPATITIYITREQKRGEAITSVVENASIDAIVEKSALLSMREVNPYITGVFLENHSHFQEAADIAKKLIERQGQSLVETGKARVLLGRALAGMNDPDAAIMQFQQAAQLGAAQSSSHFMVWFSFNPNRIRDAIERHRNRTNLAAITATAYNGWGVALHAKGMDKDAIVEYRAAIDASPNDKIPNIWAGYPYYNWGNLLAGEDKYQDAIDKYQKATKADPTNARAFTVWGSILGKLNRPDEAISKLRLAIAADDQYADPLIVWGNLLYDEERYPEASEKYRRAIALDPSIPLSYVGLGDTLSKQRKNYDAEKMYRKALNLDVNFAAAYKGLGQTLYNTHRYRQAAESFRLAAELTPQDDQVYNGWGVALDGLGDFKGAIAKYKRAIKINPSSSVARRNLMMEYAKLDISGDVAKRRESDRAGASGQTPTLEELGDLLSSRKEFDLAAHAYELAARRNAREDLYLKMGGALIYASDLDSAILAFKEAIRLNQRSAIANFGWGEALRLGGHGQAAIVQYQRAIKLDPRYKEAYLFWGIVLANQGQPEDAIGKFSTAVTIDQKYAEAYRLWATVLQRQGKEEEAKEKFAIFTRLSEKD